MVNESLINMLESQTMVLTKHTAKFEAMLIESEGSGETAFYAGITALLATIKHSVIALLTHPDAEKHVDKAMVLLEVKHMMQLTLSAMYEGTFKEQIQEEKDTMQ